MGKPHAKSNKHSGNKRAKSTLSGAVVCPAVLAVVEPALAKNHPDVAVVAVSIISEQGTPHVDIAIELASCSNQPARLQQSSIAALPKISLETCETISRELGEVIAAIPQLVDQRYNLSFGSPGVFRRLTTLRECQFYINWPVKLAVGKKTAIDGWIAATTNSTVTITSKDDNANHLIEINELDSTTALTLNPTLAMPNDSDDNTPD